jgi:predicted RNA-binding Zn-ribbon protein involved in translation (DUF1610 family)
MCVQNVPFKTREKKLTLRMHKEDRKQPKDECWINVNGVDLLVGFVPICGSNRPLTVKCPMCGLVMMHNGTKYFCPDCGILG